MRDLDFRLQDLRKSKKRGARFADFFLPHSSSAGRQEKQQISSKPFQLAPIVFDCAKKKKNIETLFSVFFKCRSSFKIFLVFISSRH